MTDRIHTGRQLRPYRVFGILLTALTGLLLVLAAAGCGSPDASGGLDTPSGGKLVIGETEHDFGDVSVGETVTHSYKITNTGDGTLLLGEPEVEMLEGC